MLPRRHQTGSTNRLLLRLATVAAATALTIVLAGCPFYLFGIARLPELLLDDSFDWIDEEDWEFGTTDGSPIHAQIIAGSLLVFGPHHFLTTKRVFGGSFTVRLEWSVLTDDPPMELVPEDGPDFRITIESRRATAGLELYRWKTVPAPDFYDTLWIRDRDGVDIVPPVSIVSINQRQGRLEVQFTASGGEPGMYADVPELGLNLWAPLPAGGLFDATRVTLGASGLVIPSVEGDREHPRVLEQVYIARWFE